MLHNERQNSVDASRPLDGRVAVVTGAASGLGRACCELLSERGAVVVAVDIDGERLRQVYAGSAVTCVVADVSIEADVQRATEIAAELGSAEIVVNAAAALGPEVFGRDRDVATMDVDVWDTTMAVNLRGTMLLSKHTVGRMAAAGRGSIINIGSGSASAGNTARVAYASSKAGVITLSQYIATAYGRFGVRCNVVAPGLIMTEGAARGITDSERRRIESEHLVPRLGVPADIAEVVAFLASDAAGFVTGQTWTVDGGLRVHHAGYRPLEEAPPIT